MPKRSIGVLTLAGAGLMAGGVALWAATSPEDPQPVVAPAWLAPHAEPTQTISLTLADPPESDIADSEMVWTDTPEAISDEEAALRTRSPATLEEARDLDRRVRDVVDEVMPATVGVRVGRAWGSGVIVSPDGYVMTAGHVIGRAGRQAVIYLPDGTQIRGRTLGLNMESDSGLIKLDADEPLPYAEVGDSDALTEGEWTVALGHPGGWDEQRTPPARLGRLIRGWSSTGQNRSNFLTTDNTLVGGDSGGPLFNLAGEVVGIHSRIGSSLESNLHTPAAAFKRDWERLANNEVWPGQIGVYTADDDNGVRVARLVEGKPAEAAGIVPGDVITAVNDAPINDSRDLREQILSRSVGEVIRVTVIRGETNQTEIVEVEIAERS
jgi:serine protease Do